jgi:hypothetical protein
MVMEIINSTNVKAGLNRCLVTEAEEDGSNGPACMASNSTGFGEQVVEGGVGESVVVTKLEFGIGARGDANDDPAQVGLDLFRDRQGGRAPEVNLSDKGYLL